MYGKVTLIDDDPINNLICEKLIQRQGFAEQVNSFISANEGLQWLCDLNPDQYPGLILLDINLPTMDGWEFLSQLEVRLPEQKICIYLLSSSVSQIDQQKAAVHPLLTGFLMKPLNAAKLEQLECPKPP